MKKIEVEKTGYRKKNGFFIMEKKEYAEAGYRKVSRFLKLCLVAVTCASMMCACSGGTSGKQAEQEAVKNKQPQTETTETTENKQPQTETTETTENKQPQTEAANSEPLSLEKLYEKTDLDHIYKLTNVDTTGYGVREADLKDGYVFLLLQDYSEEGTETEFGVSHLLQSGKLVLFPLAHPDEVVSREVDEVYGRYYLLADGSLAALDWGGDYTIYDSKLEEVQHGNIDGNELLGVSDEGDLWGMTEDAQLVRYQDGNEVNSYQVEGAISGSFKGEYGGKAYFSMFDEARTEFFVSINLTDGSIEKQEFLNHLFTVSNEWISYKSEDRWYTAKLEDPCTVTGFDKPVSNDSIWDIDENYLIGILYHIDDSENYDHNLHVFDRRTGGLCDEKKSTELAGEELVLYDYDQGIVLYGDVTSEMAANGLYLWNLNELTAEYPDNNYSVVDYRADQAQIDAMIQDIYKQYGVTVYYDQAHLDECNGSYLLTEVEDKKLLGYTLTRLTECMAEYPNGYFEELKSEYFNDVVYYIAGKHENNDADAIADAAGTVHVEDDVLIMTLDANSWWNLRRIFLHENMHMIDAVLEQANGKVTQRNIYEYWFNELNSPEFASMQHYNYEESEENLKGIYEEGKNPEEVWYIDSYSKSTMGEDRARIMENSIYSKSDCYFESSHIERKLRNLNALIREVFECVKSSEDPVFWETRTGIVDLREEFPDIYAN